MGTIISIPVVVVVAAIILAVYLLPSIIALANRNKRRRVILFNIFLGWTFVMWIICLVWAYNKD